MLLLPVLALHVPRWELPTRIFLNSRTLGTKTDVKKYSYSRLVRGTQVQNWLCYNKGSTTWKMVRKIITTVVLVATLASSGLSKTLLPSKCPTYWTAFGDYCYRFFGQRVNLREAQFNCRLHGSGGRFGYLASIHSQEENDFIGMIFKSSSPSESVGWHLWIGLNDEREEGHFVWSDGAHVNFTLWAPGQPEGGRRQQGVVIISPTAGDFGLWHDDAVSSLNNYICKLPHYD